VSIRQNRFVVDNATDGFDLHHLDDGALIHTLSTGSAVKRVPKQVVFGENSDVIVGGSDHGKVYVFDGKDGAALDILQHASGGLVQTVAVCCCGSSINHLRKSHRRTLILMQAQSSARHRVTARTSTRPYGCTNIERTEQLLGRERCG
jgi:hypothetical protein